MTDDVQISLEETSARVASDADGLEDELRSKVALAARVADDAGEFKQAAFEKVLAHLLAESQQRSLTAPPAAAQRRSAAKGLGGFLASHGLTEDQVAGTVDLQSGRVLAMNLGKSNSERQRKLAALIALHHLAKDGALYVAQDELVTACKKSSCYDSNNFAANMASAKTKDARAVFLRRDDGSGWEVSIPGATFVAETVRGLLVEVSTGG